MDVTWLGPLVSVTLRESSEENEAEVMRAGLLVTSSVLETDVIGAAEVLVGGTEVEGGRWVVSPLLASEG